MGFYRDCRSCVHYHDSYFYSNSREKYRCSYSGNYFDDEFGETCRSYYSIQQAQYDKREAKERELSHALLVYTFLGNNENKADEDDDEEKRQDNGDGEIGILSFFIKFMLFYFITDYLETKYGGYGTLMVLAGIVFYFRKFFSKPFFVRIYKVIITLVLAVVPTIVIAYPTIPVSGFIGRKMSLDGSDSSLFTAASFVLISILVYIFIVHPFIVKKIVKYWRRK